MQMPPGDFGLVESLLIDAKSGPRSLAGRARFLDLILQPISASYMGSQNPIDFGLQLQENPRALFAGGKACIFCSVRTPPQ
jgi:hypothetical protein